MPRQSREKGPLERRAHAAAADAGLSWEQLAEKLGKSTDTLTRRLWQMDDGRTAFPYETAETLLRRITVLCEVGPGFFEMDFGEPELTESAGDDAEDVPGFGPP